ncbi:MAG: lysophospholipid acyltransferase family protein [Akkermansia sp.]|nr:lysophospholipid acyltransferase family protein [Akkermansia sp.]
MSSTRNHELRSKWWSRPLGHIAWFLISLVCFTLRKRVVNGDASGDGETIGSKPVIVSLWHNRTFVPCYFYKYVLKGSVQMSMLTSASKDGAMLATVAEDYGMRAVRGSSGRRGVAGFLDMMRELKAGYSMCITPDGPKGPRYRCHPGVIKLASVSGLPIIPVGIDIPHCWRINKAWDGFVIPKPFSKVILRWGAPLYVPENISDAEIKVYCERLEQLMAYGRPDFEPIDEKKK